MLYGWAQSDRRITTLRRRLGAGVSGYVKAYGCFGPCALQVSARLAVDL